MRDCLDNLGTNIVYDELKTNLQDIKSKNVKVL